MRVSTELDLSPYVIEYWQSRGFCVHGEVALYSKSIFIDHVAHRGACASPTYVVAIEMKKGASKSLRKQMWTLDRKHVADELWGVCISTPRSTTLEKWEDSPTRHASWIAPGLLSWNGDGFDQQCPSRVTLQKNHKRYYRTKVDELLLVPENQGCLGGYPSGGDHDYVTHWSLSCERILSWAQEQTGFTTQDLFDNLPACMAPYRKKRAAMNRVLRHLLDEGHLQRQGKQGRYNKYAAV